MFSLLSTQKAFYLVQLVITYFLIIEIQWTLGFNWLFRYLVSIPYSLFLIHYRDIDPDLKKLCHSLQWDCLEIRKQKWLSLNLSFNTMQSCGHKRIDDVSVISHKLTKDLIKKEYTQIYCHRRSLSRHQQGQCIQSCLLASKQKVYYCP